MDKTDRVYQVVSQHINESDPMGLLKDRKDASVNYDKQIDFICSKIKECPTPFYIQGLMAAAFTIDFPVMSVFPYGKYSEASHKIYNILKDILPTPEKI